MSDGGEHTPQPTRETAAPATGRPRVKPLALAVQGGGFLLGIAVLGWVLFAASEQLDADNLAKIRSAEPWRIGAIVLLSVCSVGLMGGTWWSVIAPVRRLGLADCVCVNASANALALLPFKLSVLFRVAYHRARDDVPILTFGAWTAALCAVLLISLGPPTAAAVFLQSGSPAWWGASMTGVAALALVTVPLARTFATGTGWNALRGVIERTPGGLGPRVTASRAFANAHAGVEMLSSPPWLALACGTRLLDAAAYAARFWLAASIIDVPLAMGQAAVLGVSYFVISVLAPTGSAGPREAGAAGLSAIAAFGLPEETLLVVAIVGVVEIAVAAVTGPIGLGVLRLRGPLFRRTPEIAEPGADSPGARLP